MREPQIGETWVAEPRVPTRHQPSVAPCRAFVTASDPAAEVPSDADTHRRLQTLAFELSVAEARERQRVAQVLHDEVGQLLAMVQFRLSDLRQTHAAEPDDASRFDEVLALLRQAAQATRAATFELHSPVLQQLGLVAAVQGLADRLQRSARLDVRVWADLPELALGDAVLSVLFRIVRELMLNVQKHARASTLSVSLVCESNTLCIGVSDNGVGFDAHAATHQFSPEGGFGLISAEAQMQGIGGQLHIDSTPGQGSTATLRLPVMGFNEMPPRAQA